MNRTRTLQKRDALPIFLGLAALLAMGCDPAPPASAAQRPADQSSGSQPLPGSDPSILPHPKNEPYAGDFTLHPVFEDRVSQKDQEILDKKLQNVIAKVELRQDSTFELTLKTPLHTLDESGTWAADGTFHLKSAKLDLHPLDLTQALTPRIESNQLLTTGNYKEFQSEFPGVIIRWDRNSGAKIIFPDGREQQN